MNWGERSLITTEPAPTVVHSPTFTLGINELPIPSNAPSPTITRPPNRAWRDVNEIANSAIVIYSRAVLTIT